jgi:glycyl-tRNA synthetase
MNSTYNKNGLVFWTEREIKLRETFVEHLSLGLKDCLKLQNKAFEFIRVEAPVLTPIEFINKNYTENDYYVSDYGDLGKPNLVLRPETTMGSYEYAKYLLHHTENKIKMPLCIWQHGKSFRKEQDQVMNHMRLKEFYQLEFQCIYSLSTQNEYSVVVISVVKDLIASFIGDCYTTESDRLPDYSNGTIDVVCGKNNMEVCSVSRRNDFPDANVLEIAIGTDRLVYNFLNK